MDILSDVNVVGNLSVSGSIGAPGQPNFLKIKHGITINSDGSEYGGEFLGGVDFCKDNRFYGKTIFYNNPTRKDNHVPYSYSRQLEISNFKAFPETFLIRVPENCSKFLIKDYWIKMSDGTNFSISSEFLIRPLVNSYSGDLGTNRVDMDVEISVTSEIGCYRESVLGVITPFSSVSNLFVSVADSIM